MGLGWNRITSYGRYTISLLVTFLLVPLLIHTVGEEDFGLFSLLFSVLGIVGLLDLGFAAAAVKYVAQADAEGNVRGRNSIVSTLLVCYLGLALLALFVLVALSLVLPEFFGISGVQSGKADALLWILGARMVLFQLPLGLFRGVLFARKQITLVNALATVSNVAYGLMAAWALSLGYGIVAVGLASLIAMLLEHLCYVVLCYLRVPEFSLSMRLVSWHRVAELSGFSWHQFVCDAAALVLLQMDLLLVQSLMDLRAVALYAIALRIATQVHYFCKQFINTLSPSFASLSSQGKLQDLRALFVRSSDYALAPAVFFLVSAAVLGPATLHLWVGAQFEASFNILLILLLAVALGVLQNVAGNLLANSGFHRVLSRASLISVLANIILSLVFYSWFGLGGIALGTLATKVCVDFPLVVVRACREYQIRPTDYLMGTLSTYVLPAAAQYGTLLTLKQLFGLDSWTQLLVCGLGGGLVFAVSLLYFRNEKDLIRT